MSGCFNLITGVFLCQILFYTLKTIENTVKSTLKRYFEKERYFYIVSRQEETRSHSFQKTTKHHSNHNLFYKFIYRIKTTSQTYNTK